MTVLDALRQPLEEGVVRVSRSRGSADLPARFLLVGAMNPCPCGEGAALGACRCSPAAKARYFRRLSGPLLDRFDLVVPLRRTPPGELMSPAPGEASAVVAARVFGARRVAKMRGVRCNSDIPSSQIPSAVPLSAGAAEILERSVRTGQLSGRGVDRVRRVARTIADLSGAPPDSTVEEGHVAEALALRAGREVLDLVGAPSGDGM